MLVKGVDNQGGFGLSGLGMITGNCHSDRKPIREMRIIIGIESRFYN